MKELAFLFSYLGNNSEWSLLEPTEKGYFIELLVFASNPKNLGCIPNDDEKLRHLLNIPLPFYNILEEEEDPIKYYFKGFEKHNINQIMIDSIKTVWKNEHSIEDKITSRFSYEQWIDFFWTNKWKKNILSEWIIVDDKLIKKYPNLKSSKDLYWNETAYQISTGNFDFNKKVVKKTTRKKTVVLPDLKEQDIFENNEVSILGIQWLNNDIKNLLDVSQTLKCWREPATELQKHTIWEVGVSLLSGNKASKKSQAQAIIAKQVKIYGNFSVSKAIGELASKNNISEPLGLFLAILKRDNEGTREEIKARNKRVSNNL